MLTILWNSLGTQEAQLQGDLGKLKGISKPTQGISWGYF